MKKKSLVVVYSLDQRLAHILLLRTHFLRDIGFLQGKMGVLLAIADYYQRVLNPVFDAFMDDLLDEILKEIHQTLPVGLGNGLCGIGWGIEYLIQNHLLEGCSFELCEELDKKIMETDLRKLTNMSLEIGLEGILHYVLAHIKGAFLQESPLPFEKTYYDDLFHAIQMQQHRPISTELQVLISQYINFYIYNKIPDYELSLEQFIQCGDIPEHKLVTSPLGLSDGLAGALVIHKTA